jgi:DNA-binding FadR family transcriptional regulator
MRFISSDLNPCWTLVERIAGLIRHRVLNSTLRAGMPNREADLSRKLNVSRHLSLEAPRCSRLIVS